MVTVKINLHPMIVQDCVKSMNLYNTLMFNHPSFCNLIYINELKGSVMLMESCFNESKYKVQKHTKSETIYISFAFDSVVLLKL